MQNNLHFTDAEFAARRTAACGKLADAGLDGILMFRQESMYYLTGYDTFGFRFFQCLIMTADGRFVLLTRSADQRQAAFTSIVDDIRVWVDGADANPANDLRASLMNSASMAPSSASNTTVMALPRTMAAACMQPLMALRPSKMPLNWSPSCG